MAATIGIESRCRVAGLRDLAEDDEVALMEAAALEVERRVPQVCPVVAIEGDVLVAVGSFALLPDRNPYDDAETFVHELSLGLRAALKQLAIAEVMTVVRELVPA